MINWILPRSNKRTANQDGEHPEKCLAQVNSRVSHRRRKSCRVGMKKANVAYLAVSHVTFTGESTLSAMHWNYASEHFDTAHVFNFIISSLTQRLYSWWTKTFSYINGAASPRLLTTLATPFTLSVILKLQPLNSCSFLGTPRSIAASPYP